MQTAPLPDHPQRTLPDAERIDWLRLIRSENVGAVTFAALLRRYGSAAAALAALPELARRGGREALRIATRADAEREIEATAKAGARLVALGEPDYPAALPTIHDAPPLIAVLGRPDVAADPARVVAIVGARNASGVGARFARTLAAELGSQGFIIASGLARGIDGAAHAGALATGTIALMAGGVDQPYPAENRELYAQIAERGLVIAEQPVGTEPHARHFPRRNRLVSGVSCGVVVVEAALHSGSLITARMALEQGREVFAVPGSPLDPRCKGSNNLLREGAALVESAADVTAALRGLRTLREPAGDSYRSVSAVTSEAELGAGRARVRELLGPSPLPVDEIIRQSRLTPATVLTILLELELAGRLQRHPGNQVSLL
ncbi:MAG: DNA-protecting protein DprA [Alphaproteobacteria bacterium]|nr:DNA-protecting protein DprA [Alphaproteobacteria bacterium]